MFDMILDILDWACWGISFLCMLIVTGVVMYWVHYPMPQPF